MKRLITRRSATTAVGLAAIGLATLVATGTASAATVADTARPLTYGEFSNYVTSNGVNIRSGPGTGYTSLGQAQRGEVDDFCWSGGTVINGDPAWDYITDLATGVSGYVSEYYLSDKSQSKFC